MLKLKLKREPTEEAGSTRASSPAATAEVKAEGPADPPAAPASPGDPGAPKGRIKLNLNLDKKPANPVRLRLRTNKVVNDGFDIEAPDREDDPTIEEAIVLRMLPNTAALATLRKAVDTNDYSGINVRFEDRRHAVVAVAGDEYHAQLMDLPTVTEVHKTVDRRNIFKTVDVSQILLVTHKVGDPKPSLQQYTQFTQDPQAFPHGLTAPMYNVRNRRFQHRMSTKAVEAIESQVEELLKRDAEAREVTTELLPASAVAAQQALAEAARAAARARTEESDMDIDDDLDEELERAMMNDEDEDLDEDLDGDEDEDLDGEDLDDEDGGRRRSKSSGAGSRSGAGGRASTPGSKSRAGADSSEGEDDEDEDDDDDDEDDDDRQAGDRGEEDDDVRQHNKQLREEIKELEVTIQAKEKLASSVVNEIMRARHMDAVTRLRAELEKKKGLLRDAGGLDKDEAGGSGDQNNGEDEFDDDDDDDVDDDDDDAPEMPEGAGLPEVPQSAGSIVPGARASAEESSEQMESNAADLRLRDQLSGQLTAGSPGAGEEGNNDTSSAAANNEDIDIDIDDLF